MMNKDSICRRVMMRKDDIDKIISLISETWYWRDYYRWTATNRRKTHWLLSSYRISDVRTECVWWNSLWKFDILIAGSIRPLSPPPWQDGGWPQGFVFRAANSYHNFFSKMWIYLWFWRWTTDRNRRKRSTSFWLTKTETCYREDYVKKS